MKLTIYRKRPYGSEVDQVIDNPKFIPTLDSFVRMKWNGSSAQVIRIVYDYDNEEIDVHTD